MTSKSETFGSVLIIGCVYPLLAPNGTAQPKRVTVGLTSSNGFDVNTGGSGDVTSAFINWSGRGDKRGGDEWVDSIVYSQKKKNTKN